MNILELRSACYESAAQKDKALADAQLAYRYEYFSGWLSSVDSVARIKRLTGKEPPVPVVSKEKSAVVLEKNQND
ncbi:MAG: hypothetical protein P4L53_24545 [Candidatus Obscuribacterales bacterium]|nr:hypothetical protein [Candidatus Obscuribacterales bacterium]